MPGQNRSIPNFPRFQGNISQGPLKVFYQKIVFDFTVGRLPEHVKILLRWIYDFCLQQPGKVHKVVVVFKSGIYTTSVSLTIKRQNLGISHNWPNKHV